MMKHKGSELAPLDTFASKAPADIEAKAKVAAILGGKFSVSVDDSQPKSTAKQRCEPTRVARQEALTNRPGGHDRANQCHS